MIRAAIFDMDGVLIDSEPMWHRAEIEVLGALGVPITPARCLETMGMRADEMARHWHRRHPWSGPTADEVALAVVRRVESLVRERGRALPGVRTLVAALGGRMPLAVASSSPRQLIDTVLEHLGLGWAFEARCSAMEERRGKPDPAVFLSAARAVGVDADACVVFEDSPTGVEAARAAGMRVVAVPAAELFHHPGFEAADLKLESLEQFALSALDASA